MKKPLPKKKQSSGGTAPKRQCVRRRAAAGLLGVGTYHSSDDEDFVPTGLRGQRRGAAKASPAVRPAAGREEDLPLAQRRRLLQGRRAHEAAAAASPAAGAAARPAPPSLHLPEEVIAAILRVSCSAGGAIPALPVGEHCGGHTRWLDDCPWPPQPGL